MHQRRIRDRVELFTIADAAIVLPPSHLTGIGRPIPGDVMVRADLGATQSGPISADCFSGIKNAPPSRPEPKERGEVRT